MILRPSPVSSKFFSFKNNSFVAEMSDLQDNLKRFDRVYTDSADIGFSIVSEKSGASCVFAMTEMIRDDEGELQFWNFVCVTPGFKNLKAVIFND
jgi:hypothetical protein